MLITMAKSHKNQAIIKDFYQKCDTALKRHFKNQSSDARI